MKKKGKHLQSNGNFSFESKFHSLKNLVFNEEKKIIKLYDIGKDNNQRMNNNQVIANVIGLNTCNLRFCPNISEQFRKPWLWTSKTDISLKQFSEQLLYYIIEDCAYIFQHSVCLSNVNDNF